MLVVLVFNLSLYMTDVNECKSKVCDHMCVNSHGSFKCACYHGYELVHHIYCKPDGTSMFWASTNRLLLSMQLVWISPSWFVFVDSVQPIILVSHIDKIINSTIDGRRSGVFLADLNHAVALDYHFNSSYVFFTDVKERKIFRSIYGSNIARVGFTNDIVKLYTYVASQICSAVFLRRFAIAALFSVIKATSSMYVFYSLRLIRYGVNYYYAMKNIKIKFSSYQIYSKCSLIRFNYLKKLF